MARKESPPPVYQPPESSSEPRRPSSPASSVPDAAQESTMPLRTKKAIILVVLFCSLLCGTWIDRRVSADPNDSRVRRRIMRQWGAKMEKFQRDEDEFVKRRERMNEDYRHEEDEWKQKIAKFEEELKQKALREQWERQRARLYWVNIRPAEHCISSGHKSPTREYPATPLTINGVTYNTPLTCEDTGIGLWGGVFGSWVAENEASCASYWAVVNRKGCTAPKSGFRRFETKFGPVHTGEDAEMLCLSTPLTINGRSYERPVACPYLNIFAGHWGMWDIPDEICG